VVQSGAQLHYIQSLLYTAIQNILAYTSETSCGCFLFMFDDLGLMKRRFWLNSSTAATYVLFFFVMEQQVNISFFQTQRNSSRNIWKASIGLWNSMYHLCISENGWEIWRGKWGPWRFCMEWV